MDKVTFVQKKGQITLPGSLVRVSVKEKSIVVEPAQVVSKDERSYTPNCGKMEKTKAKCKKLGFSLMQMYGKQ